MFHNIDFTNDYRFESPAGNLKEHLLFYIFSTMKRFLIVAIIFSADSDFVERIKDKAAQ
jgi:hypothetical protein